MATDTRARFEIRENKQGRYDVWIDGKSLIRGMASQCEAQGFMDRYYQGVEWANPYGGTFEMFRD